MAALLAPMPPRTPGRDARLTRRLLDTPLASMGGAAVVELLDARALANLRAESDAQAHGATTTYVAAATAEAAAAGDPDRALDSAPGGVVLDALYHAPAVFELLATVTGLRWVTTGERGTYSYYRRPGHHLGLHRDIETCELAFITCVRDDRSPTDDGGVLVLYPGRANESLDSIRDTPAIGAVPVRLRAGQSIVLLGGLVPHRLTPVGPGQARVISPLCYRLAE